MGSRGRTLRECLMWVFVVMMTSSEVAEAETHDVGGTDGWKVPSNTTFYSEWATNKNFSVGDSLNFTWSGSHDVAETTKAEYDGCSGTNVLLRSSATVNLTTAGPKYYICTIDSHCRLGQKLAINVTASTSPTPPASVSPPPPPPPSSSVSSIAVDALFATKLASPLLVHFLAWL